MLCLLSLHSFQRAFATCPGWGVLVYRRFRRSLEGRETRAGILLLVHLLVIPALLFNYVSKTRREGGTERYRMVKGNIHVCFA